MTPPRLPPYPYSYLVRKLGQPRSANVGFMTKLFDEPGVPWTEDVFGGIPGVLNRGGSEINFGENLEYSGWDRLDRGGMGAEFANDRTRYRLSAGLYCGDPGEIYPQPIAYGPQPTDGDVPAWEPASAVLPPATEHNLTHAGVTNDTTFTVGDATNLKVGAACRIGFTCQGDMTAGSKTVTITENLFGHFDDDEHVMITIPTAGPGANNLNTTVQVYTDTKHVDVNDAASHTATAVAVTWYYERRIKSITLIGAGPAATIEIMGPIVNFPARAATAHAVPHEIVIVQLAQTVVDVLIWRIPAAVPDALIAPVNPPVITADAKSADMVNGDTYQFVFTKISPWGESLPSTASVATGTGTVAGQKSLAIQFGSNAVDDTVASIDGIKYKANTKDYPGVTGYRIYAQKSDNPDVAAGYSEEKLKFVAEIPIRPNQQQGTATNKLKPRHVHTGKPLLEGRPPEYVAGVSTTRRDMVIVVTTDGIRTYLYRVNMHGEVSTLAPIQPVNDVVRLSDSTSDITPGLLGTVRQKTCTVWNSQLIVPTIDASGRRSITRVWYDSTKGLHADGYSLKFRYRSSEGILGHLVYAENTRRLWRCYKNLAWWSSDPFGGDPGWTGPISIGTNEYDVAQMIAYGGAKNSSDSATYFTKPDGLYRILDTSDGPSRRAEWITTFGVPDLNYGYPLVDHRGELYIGIGEHMLRYTIANVDLTGPNRDGGLCQSLRGWCGGAVSTNRHLYIGTGMRHPDRTHYFYQQILETEQGEAWHQLYCREMDGKNLLEVMPEYDPTDIDFEPPGYIGWGPILLVVPADMSSGLASDPTENERTGDGWSTMIASIGFHENIALFPIRNAGERLREARGYKPRTAPAMLELPKTFSGNNRPLDQTWHYLRVAQSKLTRPANQSGFRIQYKLDNPFQPVDYDWEVMTYSNQWLLYENYLTVDEDAAADVMHPTIPGEDPPPPPPYTDVNWLYAIEDAVQFISGGEDSYEIIPTPPIDEDPVGHTLRPIVRSPGISFRIDIHQEEGIPLVLGEIVLASSPTSVPLGRWIFEAVLKRYQQLGMKNSLNMTNPKMMENVTNEEFFGAYEQLLAFAKSSDPLILTDALGAEHICRMDLGHVSPGKDGVKTWTKYVDDETNVRVITEPYELRYTVTFTELYNIEDMNAKVVPPIVPPFIPV